MSHPPSFAIEALTGALQEYSTGLRKELVLLERVAKLSKQQQQLSLEGEVAVLDRLTIEREHAMAELAALEACLRPLRGRLADNAGHLASLTAFQEISHLHRDAAALVAEIAGADQHTLHALQREDLQRRSTAQTLETGEATLAAYRRALTSPSASAGLIDQVG